MFNQIREWVEDQQELMARREIERNGRLREIFESDPVADQTEWSPLVPGGANFKTRELVQTQPDQLVFKATGSAKLFSALFIALSAIVFAAGWIVGSEPMLLIIGVVFLAASILLFRQSTRLVVFDRTLGLHWRGSQQPLDSSESDATRLHDVHSVQVISERVRSSSSSRSRRRHRSYYSYELNLVLKDGSRVNVIDHGDRRAVRSDAAQVAAFIGVPFWDAT